MNPEICSARMEEDSTSNAGELFIRIYMGEWKKSMNANPVRAANIKENAVLRHRATERFV